MSRQWSWRNLEGYDWTAGQDKKEEEEEEEAKERRILKWVFQADCPKHIDP